MMCIGEVMADEMYRNCPVRDRHGPVGWRGADGTCELEVVYVLRFYFYLYMECITRCVRATWLQVSEVLLAELSHEEP